MEIIAKIFFKFVTLVFTLGWIGCLITIPLAAYKFFSVLFEPDTSEETHQEFPSGTPAKT